MKILPGIEGCLNYHGSVASPGLNNGIDRLPASSINTPVLLTAANGQLPGHTAHAGVAGQKQINICRRNLYVLVFN